MCILTKEEIPATRHRVEEEQIKMEDNHKEEDGEEDLHKCSTSVHSHHMANQHNKTLNNKAANAGDVDNLDTCRGTAQPIRGWDLQHNGNRDAQRNLKGK